MASGTRKEDEFYWKKKEEHYQAALELYEHDGDTWKFIARVQPNVFSFSIGGAKHADLEIKSDVPKHALLIPAIDGLAWFIRVLDRVVHHSPWSAMEMERVEKTAQKRLMHGDTICFNGYDNENRRDFLVALRLADGTFEEGGPENVFPAKSPMHGTPTYLEGFDARNRASAAKADAEAAEAAEADEAKLSVFFEAAAGGLGSCGGGGGASGGGGGSDGADSSTLSGEVPLAQRGLAFATAYDLAELEKDQETKEKLKSAGKPVGWYEFRRVGDECVYCHLEKADIVQRSLVTGDVQALNMCAKCYVGLYNFMK
jgi:hypothetical protein